MTLMSFEYWDPARIVSVEITGACILKVAWTHMKSGEATLRATYQGDCMRQEWENHIEKLSRYIDHEYVGEDSNTTKVPWLSVLESPRRRSKKLNNSWYFRYGVPTKEDSISQVLSLESGVSVKQHWTEHDLESFFVIDFSLVVWSEYVIKFLGGRRAFKKNHRVY